MRWGAWRDRSHPNLERVGELASFRAACAPTLTPGFDYMYWNSDSP